MRKKIFSILISLVMVLTMMPFMAVVSNADTAPEPLCFTAEASNSSVLLLKEYYDYGNDVSLLYSLNGENWESYGIGNSIELTNVGDTVYFKADGENTCFNGYRFSMTGRIAARGNIMSLLNSTRTLTAIPSNYCFSYLFYDCASLTIPPELPAKELANHCYEYMFAYCENLTQAPALPATTLAYECYGYMFWFCSKLEDAPALPATTLAEYCYSNMFYGCSGLKQTPELPATNLEDNCYYSMFRKCTKLSELPELPALVLPSSCYSYMFDDCPQFNLSEQGNDTCFKTFSIPSNAIVKSSYSLNYMMNGRTPTPGVTYYYSPHHENIVKIEGKDSTCDGAGYKDYYFCDDCKWYFSDAAGNKRITDIDAWKAGEGKIATKPHSIKKVKGKHVCTGTGWKDYYKCEKCSTRFSDKDGKNEITNLDAWKAGAGKLVNPGHVVNSWTAGTVYHYGECVYCHEIVSVSHSGSPCGVCGYVASEVQEPEDDEEYILDEEETSDENGAVEGEEDENPQEVSSIFSNGTLWIVLVIGLAAIAGVAVLAMKKRD